MIGKKEHREVVERLAEKFEEHGLNLLLLGSSSVLYRYGDVRRTKDIDVHPFPIDPYEEFYEKLEDLSEELDGTFNIEIDGSTITFFAEIDEKRYTIELIDAGGPHFLTNKVLEDMIDKADKIEGLYVPSDEHLVVAKAEAYIDRSENDPNKEKFFDDLNDLREKMVEKDIEHEEIDRVIGLRPERKHEELKRIITLHFSDIY